MLRRTGRFRPAAPAVPTAFLTLLAALCCALVTLLGAAGSAAGATAYTTAPSIALSQTNPCEQATITLTGQSFTPGGSVTVSVGSQVFGKPTAGSDGSLTFTFTLPPRESGRVTVTADGGTSDNTATTELDINGDCAQGVSAGPSSGPSSAGHSTHTTSHSGSGSKSIATGTGGSGSGGAGALSYTGVAIFSMLILAFVLLGAGLLLVLGGRRRRATA